MRDTGCRGCPARVSALGHFVSARCPEGVAGCGGGEQGGAQVLLRGLPGAQPGYAPHAVQSADWYHPVAAELPAAAATQPEQGHRLTRLAGQRATAEQTCLAALAGRPKLLIQFEQLLRVNQRYAVIREEQARDFTLAWPVLRTCVRRLGEHLVESGALSRPDDVYFWTHDEVAQHLAGRPGPAADVVRRRRDQWHRQRAVAAPLTLGHPARLIGDVIDRAVQQARGPHQISEGVIVGHPASAGRATGPVRIVHSTQDFPEFRAGDVLVAKATAPAWTPLFARAAAVVTDGGTLAAHAPLVAREYAIPAVVGTGDATMRLRPGQLVTVDGTAGTVTAHDEPAAPAVDDTAQS